MLAIAMTPTTAMIAATTTISTAVKPAREFHLQIFLKGYAL